jgi:hypothetical protein
VTPWKRVSDNVAKDGAMHETEHIRVRQGETLLESIIAIVAKRE